MTRDLLLTVLLGALQLLTTAVLSWIGFEIRNTRKVLEEKVDRDDCNRDMCRHYTEIQNLWKDTRNNSERIAKIEGKNDVSVLSKK